MTRRQTPRSPEVTGRYERCQTGHQPVTRIRCKGVWSPSQANRYLPISITGRLYVSVGGSQTPRLPPLTIRGSIRSDSSLPVAQLPTGAIGLSPTLLISTQGVTPPSFWLEPVREECQTLPCWVKMQLSATTGMLASAGAGSHGQARCCTKGVVNAGGVALS